MNKPDLLRGDGRPGEAGFTLLELLVAMTIMSLVALLVLGGLKFGIGAWKRAETTNDDAEAVEVVQRLLRRQLSDIYPLWQPSGPGRVVFDGGERHLEFIAEPPVQLGPGAHLIYDLDLTDTGDLVLQWAPTENDANVEPTRSTLLAHLQSVRFMYFGSDPNGQSMQWWDSWQKRVQLPRLISIAIEFPANDRRFWPELIVHPAITADVACIYDPISRGCRGRPQ